MKIGPMIQNPGRVLCHIFMVGLLSQVMDNAIGNVNVVNDSAIMAGGKTQSVLSQVVEGNIGNKDHRDVDVTMDKENNPEQVPTSQVVGVIDVNEVYGDVDVIMNEEDGNVVNLVNVEDEVWPSQVVETDIDDEDHGDVDMIMNIEDGIVVNVVNR